MPNFNVKHKQYFGVLKIAVENAGLKTYLRQIFNNTGITFSNAQSFSYIEAIIETNSSSSNFIINLTPKNLLTNTDQSYVTYYMQINAGANAIYLQPYYTDSTGAIDNLVETNDGDFIEYYINIIYNV